MPHAMLHDDRCLKTALFGTVDDALDTVLDTVFAGVIRVIGDITQQCSRFSLIGVARESQMHIPAE